ncbi:very short patch repair endonuclease [Leptospira barantonii]|uniref:Very short patch repair endonuclease n=1 Tax=Leptospira barantonii TaxID=2023184 RepID=A0ABX4NNF8_9LEPT|nr:very short patch repair endonuclease [Leptospira barantonii]PJZ57456.1 very short patch repair endonuclease [Leptospira barantonii]
MDVVSVDRRSWIMSQIKSKGNSSTELSLIKLFRIHKLKGWRRNILVIGKPDFVFPNHKVAVFADGCFWHGHNCRNLKPKSNISFWEEKIENNKNRDKKINKKLRESGWSVFRIWECNIKNGKISKRLIDMIHSKSL